MILSSDVTEYRSAFLDLEYAASEPYNRFVYESRAQADLVRGLIFDKGTAEFLPIHSRVLLRNGTVVGAISCLSAAELSRCRLRSAYALSKAGFYGRSPDLADRIALASKTLMKLAPNDFYLSRIAASPVGAGQGVGPRLFQHCEQMASKANAARICLEVSGGNAAAIRFYEKHGFQMIGRAIAEDNSRGRLEYCHMAKDLLVEGRHDHSE